MEKLINEVINYLIINKKETLNEEINNIIYGNFELSELFPVNDLNVKDLIKINDKRKEIIDIYKLIDKLEEIKKEL